MLVFILPTVTTFIIFHSFWSPYSIRRTVKPTFKEPKKRELFCPIPFKILLLRGISSSIRSSFHTSLNQSSSGSYTSILTKMSKIFLSFSNIQVSDLRFYIRISLYLPRNHWIERMIYWSAFIHFLQSITCYCIVLRVLIGITENCSYLHAFLWFVRNCWC